MSHTIEKITSKGYVDEHAVFLDPLDPEITTGRSVTQTLRSNLSFKYNSYGSTENNGKPYQVLANDETGADVPLIGYHDYSHGGQRGWNAVEVGDEEHPLTLNGTYNQYGEYGDANNGMKPLDGRPLYDYKDDAGSNLQDAIPLMDKDIVPIQEDIADVRDTYVKIHTEDGDIKADVNNIDGRVDVTVADYATGMSSIIQADENEVAIKRVDDATPIGSLGIHVSNTDAQLNIENVTRADLTDPSIMTLYDCEEDKGYAHKIRIPGIPSRNFSQFINMPIPETELWSVGVTFSTNFDIADLQEMISRAWTGNRMSQGIVSWASISGQVVFRINCNTQPPMPPQNPPPALVLIQCLIDGNTYTIYDGEAADIQAGTAVPNNFSVTTVNPHTFINEDSLFTINPGAYLAGVNATNVRSWACWNKIERAIPDAVLDLEDVQNNVASGLSEVDTRINNKIDKVANPTYGNIAILTQDGQIEDSGLDGTTLSDDFVHVLSPDGVSGSIDHNDGATYLNQKRGTDFRSHVGVEPDNVQLMTEDITNTQSTKLDLTPTFARLTRAVSPVSDNTDVMTYGDTKDEFVSKVTSDATGDTRITIAQDASTADQPRLTIDCNADSVGQHSQLELTRADACLFFDTERSLATMQGASIITLDDWSVLAEAGEFLKRLTFDPNDPNVTALVEIQATSGISEIALTSSNDTDSTTLTLTPNSAEIRSLNPRTLTDYSIVTGQDMPKLWQVTIQQSDTGAVGSAGVLHDVQFQVWSKTEPANLQEVYDTVMTNTNGNFVYIPAYIGSSDAAGNCITCHLEVAPAPQKFTARININGTEQDGNIELTDNCIISRVI